MNYNTAVSALMILANAYDKLDTISRKDYRTLLVLLNPIAPHVTEELNEILNLGKPICESEWLTYDENKISDETVNNFLASLKKDIEDALANPALIKEGLEKISEDESKAKYGVLAAPVVAVITNGNRLGLNFEKAYDIKEEIDNFLTIMNKETSSEEIYFK